MRGLSKLRFVLSHFVINLKLIVGGQVNPKISFIIDNNNNNNNNNNTKSANSGKESYSLSDGKMIA